MDIDGKSHIKFLFGEWIGVNVKNSLIYLCKLFGDLMNLQLVVLVSIFWYSSGALDTWLGISLFVYNISIYIYTYMRIDNKYTFTYIYMYEVH